MAETSCEEDSMEVLSEGMSDLKVSEEKSVDLDLELKEGKEGKGLGVRLARFPVRAGQPDCTYYLKYGSCRFGMKCKFNHPSKRKFSSHHKVKMTKVTESDQDDLKTKEVSSEYIEQKEHEENLDESCKDWTDHNEPEGVLESEMRGSAKKKNESNVSALFIGWWDSRNASSDESTGTVPVTDTVVKGKDKESTSEITAQECKFFNRPGGCKFGKSCKYLHVEGKPEMPSVELNFLGLPLRPGEKECPYYMRNTSCKYATNCKFHHPDPTAVPPPTDESQNHNNHNYNNNTTTNNNNINNNISGETEAELPREKPHQANQMHKSSVPTVPMVQPVQSSWQEQRTGKEPVPYLVAPPNYMPGLIPHHPYQMPVNPYFMPVHSFPHPPPPPPPSYEEYPERPGQPDCQHFLKNGFCKYRLACKYHHPRFPPPQVPAGGFLSPVGLPLKPDQPVCVYYGRFGVCKFGPACKFDHPLNYGPSAQTR
ncbi:hypothetical protein LUZ60_007790 [Juncus effusus]|nr:hypothetical protein LUZ60_007790 [Juncus effusus]